MSAPRRTGRFDVSSHPWSAGGGRPSRPRGADPRQQSSAGTGAGGGTGATGRAGGAPEHLGPVQGLGSSCGTGSSSWVSVPAEPGGLCPAWPWG
jgi:hypothetical protein